MTRSMTATTSVAPVEPISGGSVGVTDATNTTSPVPPYAAPEAKLHRVGTLAYSSRALIILFLWLLWGDFCFMLMEQVIPKVMPLKLEEWGAPNWITGLLVTTIPNAMNFGLNPIISFRSDRFRSRWGRRIPFLLFATPFVTLFLVLIGFAPELASGLQKVLPQSWAGNTVLIGLVAVLLVGFQFFNLFVSSVYYYLFNDVVPEQYLSRFLALFRIIGTIASAAFYSFVFPYSLTHTREIFIGAALLFFVVYTMMCLRVKEGEYPPPPELVEKRNGIFASVKTYLLECFTARRYWYFFASDALWSLAICVQTFDVFFAQSLGVTLDQYGKVLSAVAVLTALLLYPAGMLSDRTHPLLTMFWAKAALVIVSPINLIYLAYSEPPSWAATLWIVTQFVTVPLTALYVAAQLPMFMRILPRDRYGQFSSANAMVRSTAMVVGGFTAGLFIDLMGRFGTEYGWHYRSLPIWLIAFQALSLLFLWLLRQQVRDELRPKPAPAPAGA